MASEPTAIAERVSGLVEVFSAADADPAWLMCAPTPIQVGIPPGGIAGCSRCFTRGVRTVPDHVTGCSRCSRMNSSSFMIRQQ